MNTLLIILFVVAVLFAINQLRNQEQTSLRFAGKNPLTEIESVAYWRLKDAMGDEKIVLAQVSFSSFIAVPGRSKASFALFARARQKVADFVICNKDFSIHAIVEVDDKTHNKDKDKYRDEITEQAGFKTFRIEAKALPSVEELRAAILGDPKV